MLEKTASHLEGRSRGQSGERSGWRGGLRGEQRVGSEGAFGQALWVPLGLANQSSVSCAMEQPLTGFMTQITLEILLQPCASQAAPRLGCAALTLPADSLLPHWTKNSKPESLCPVTQVAPKPWPSGGT